MNDNLYETTINHLKNNKLVVLMLILFTLIIGGKQLKETYDLFFPSSDDRFEVTEESKTETNPEDNDSSESVSLPLEENGLTVEKISPSTPVSNKSEDQSTKYQISGYIVDEKGRGLADVEVIISSTSKRKYSNEIGYFEFSLNEIPANGEFNLSFLRQGYGNRNITYFEIPKTNIRETLKPQ